MRRSGRCASFAAVVLVAANVAGCATFATSDSKLQAVKTVGIISAVGDQVTVAKGGLTGLDNGSKSFPIEPWGLDDLIVQQATAALGGRFQVQPVTYSRSAFATIKDSVFTPANLVRGDPFKQLVRTEVSPQGLDAYIVITKAQAVYGGGHRKVEGVGFITYRTVTESYSQIYALYEIRVIDGKTFDVIDKKAAQPLGNAGNVPLAGPSRPVDGNFPISSGDGNDEGLHRAIVDLITRSLPTTLGDMHLAAVR
ncbi:hypothetical protein JQ562_38075 [Bradyrhizobium sp. AUGA SZCCT0051]|nr:hypothetical protein [Bradyrhizobium sp. AUGA SZCCT0124]MBR1316877.1 hypothetical protein [Bradyrhizobium sp. AUGA SZCCT0051]MBR1345164.1 hypothetical protein [Bradyrhizobium sp. AUGA SZCCT0105]MBR1359887.1 hypothetical protein [Bradyrhizobium sp. AUGA SZCCT0045]